MYRMPQCVLGMKCVNPEHVGTSEDYLYYVRHQKSASALFTNNDAAFLAKLGVALEIDSQPELER